MHGVDHVAGWESYDLCDLSTCCRPGVVWSVLSKHVFPGLDMFYTNYAERMVAKDAGSIDHLDHDLICQLREELALLIERAFALQLYVN